MKTLKEIRENKSITIEELAERTVLTVNQLEELELNPTKVNKISYVDFSGIATALDMHVDELREILPTKEELTAAELIEIMDDLKATNELIKLVPTATEELRKESPEQGFEISMRLINDLLESNQASFNKLNDIIHSLYE